MQVPLLALGNAPTMYSAIVRACPAGATCAFGSDAGWGPWSNVAGPGVTNFTVTPVERHAGPLSPPRLFVHRVAFRVRSAPR